ncbi:hypothetical protein POM88_035470 [Heracleum sosnowskyi]|uniref:Uncharacterized protein n=1 Tax=Heracleum sosnowskyi TaxID=360622 RepID=A0AAD8MEQ9_9APIA|nr:hypothetical protein POM88_035470 [Heracleum sosnowskyi]
MSITEMGHCRRMENGSADSCLSLLDDQTKGLAEREKSVRFSLYSSDSESSIGKNSDQGDDDEEEVQSRFNQGKNGAFGSLNSLEEALPNRKGLSNFYDGMSKSYPRLGEASESSSIKAIAKPENCYSRKRKISLALELWSGGESKRSANAKRKTLAVAVAMNNCRKSTDMRDNPFSEITFSSSSPHYSQLSENNDTRFNPGTSDSHFLFAFHLRVERHRELSLPAAVVNKTAGVPDKSGIGLFVFDRCLGLIDNYARSHTDIWLMNDNGVENCWSKLLSVEQPGTIGSFDIVWPVVFSKTRNQYLLH